MRRGAVLLGVLLALSGTYVSGAVAAVESTTPSPSSVSIAYLSGSTVYVDAGRNQGIDIGQELRVVRDGVVVATLTVRNLSSKRASCDLPEGVTGLEVGDQVVFEANLELSPEIAATGAAAGTRRRSRQESWFRRNGLWGTVGVRYLRFEDRSAFGSSYSQPAYNVRLEGHGVAGSSLDLSVDTRARQTFRSNSSGESESSSRTTVYRLLLAHPVGELFRVSLGRQSSPDLASVSIFDGALGEFRKGRWGAGVFGGTQPDPGDLSFSKQTVEFGAFGRFSSTPGTPLRWSVTGGGVSSSVDGEANRDYLFLRGILSSTRLTGYLMQELDIARGWKTDTGEATVSPTSTLLNARFRINPRLSVFSSFDNRRNIRLYRDRDTPETSFDDSYRTGWTLGAEVVPIPRVRLGADARTHRGGSGNLESYSGRFRVDRITPLRLQFSTRATRYLGSDRDGWLTTGSLSMPVAGRNRVEVHTGLRSESVELAGQETISTRWYGFQADMGLVRGLFLLFSLDITRGDTQKNNQAYSSISYRFR